MSKCKPRRQQARCAGRAVTTKLAAALRTCGFRRIQAGVSRIGLDKMAFSQALAEGTRLDGLGSFVIDGQARSYTDAWFAENPFYREFASDIELSPEVAALPGMSWSKSSQRGCAA